MRTAVSLSVTSNERPGAERSLLYLWKVSVSPGLVGTHMHSATSVV